MYIFHFFADFFSKIISIMVLIIDGKSEHVAQVWKNIEKEQFVAALDLIECPKQIK